VGWDLPVMAACITTLTTLCTLLVLAEFWELITEKVRRWRRRD
jgi:hypothetical protein